MINRLNRHNYTRTQGLSLWVIFQNKFPSYLVVVLTKDGRGGDSWHCCASWNHDDKPDTCNQFRPHFYKQIFYKYPLVKKLQTLL